VKKQFGNQVSGLREEWNDNTCRASFSVSGFAISAAMTIKETEIEIIATLPFMLAPFKSKIESILQEQMKKLLNP